MGTIQIDGSTPKITVGNATAEDATILFDGNAQDFHIGLDDTADSLVLGLGSALGTTPAITINSSQVATFAQAPVFPDGSIAVADLDIDGATDVGAAIVDADLFIMDDGAGGTNRKVTASRIKTYAGTTINNATANEIVTIASTTTELDAEANLTFDGTDVLVGGAGKVQLRDTGLYVASNADGDLDIVSDGTAADSINLESAGGITLDAGVAATGVTYEDDGTAMLSITNSSSDVVLTSKVQDKDIIFKGDDGGSAITALTIDMSDGGILQTRAGVGFPATQVASSGARVLDDYEEGDWTPVLTDGTNDAGGYDIQTGKYVKVGRFVHLACTFRATDLGSVGDCKVKGCPFTHADDGTFSHGSFMAFFMKANISNGYPGLQFPGNSVQFEMYDNHFQTDTHALLTTSTDVDTGTLFRITMQYLASA